MHITPNQRETIYAIDQTTGLPFAVQGSSTKGAIKVIGAPIANIDFDYIDAQQTSGTVDTYVYKIGGAGGTTIQTIVVTYTDATKANLDTVVYS